MSTHYIGADVDCRTTELVVRRNNKIVLALRVPTTIPALIEALRRIPSPKILAIEEGTTADWLYRNLRPHVDEMIVCDPRRNRLITDDGDKSNRIDAGKLSELLAGGFLRPVYHGATEDSLLLKQWVGLYHDRVRDAVRQVNKVRGRCRMYGVWPPAGAVSVTKVRDPWVKEMPNQALAAQLRLLFLGLDVARQQVVRARQEMTRRAKPFEIIQRWQKIPGIGPVRAITFLAYMDTPWRFANRCKRWKYCGVGLVRKATGTDKRGRPKPGRLCLELAANRALKDAMMGGAISAINQGDNVLSDLYHRLCAKGVLPSNVRHSVARKIIDKMIAMWKTNQPYEPDLA